MMGSLFDLCVRLLMALATLTGLTYKQVNVLIFVVLLPLGTCLLLARTVWLERRLHEMGEARKLTLPVVQVVFWAAVLVVLISFL